MEKLEKIVICPVCEGERILEGYVNTYFDANYKMKRVCVPESICDHCGGVGMVRRKIVYEKIPLLSEEQIEAINANYKEKMKNAKN